MTASETFKCLTIPLCSILEYLAAWISRGQSAWHPVRTATCSYLKDKLFASRCSRFFVHSWFMFIQLSVKDLGGTQGGWNPANDSNVCILSLSFPMGFCCILVEAQHPPVQIMHIWVCWWSSDGNHTTERTMYQQCVVNSLLPGYCQRMVVPWCPMMSYDALLWCPMILCSPCNDGNCAHTPYISV